MAFKTLPSNFESFQGQTRGPGTYGDNGYNEGNETPEYNDWGKRVLGAGGTVFSPDSIGFLNGVAYRNEGRQQRQAEDWEPERPSYTYTPYADDYIEKNYHFMPAEQIAAAKAQSYRDESGNLWIPNNFTQRAFYESPYKNKDSWMDKLFAAGPIIASAFALGPAFAAMGAAGAGAAGAAEAGAAGAGAAGAGAGAGAGAMASADAIGLAQMGQAAGLTGSALSEFVASGGTLGSTAAGAGGVASGFTASPYDYGPDFTSNVNDFSPDTFRADSSFNPDVASSNQYAGMTHQELVDLGQAVNPWTTNPSFADLGGTAGAAGGATGIAGLLQQLSSLSGLTTDQLTRLGGAGISSLASMYGASKLGQASMDAANRVATANQSATQLQSQMYQDQVARQQPFYQAGLNALPSYTKGVMPGGDLVRPFAATDFQADPGYGFRMSEGLKALDRSAASRGNLLSGATLKGAQRFGQDIASNEYNNAYNRYVGNQATQRNALAGLTGFAPTAAQQIGNAGSNYATNAGNLGISTATNYGNADMTGAAARQSAYTGAGGAFANALSPNPLNAYLNKQLGIA